METYEFHEYENPNFPIIFHYCNPIDEVYIHWHENLEILYFVKGEGYVTIGGEKIKASPNDIVIINSNDIHSIHAVNETVNYYCLIIDRKFCESLGFKIDQIFLQKKITDNYLCTLFESLVDEMISKRKYYEPSVLSLISVMLVHMYRNYEDFDLNIIKNNNKKVHMVKQSISYLKEHYRENIKVDDIAKSIGYSKYYFLRTFKEITGNTVIYYLNNLRIRYARNLLKTDNLTINEIAELSGFESQSYFTKVYKRYLGELPSKIRI